MLPITVDVARVPIMLVGDGAAACRRLGLLDGAGAKCIEVYAVAPSPELVEAAGPRLHRRLPQAADMARARLVFLAGIGEPDVSRLRRAALRAGVLLNVEDDIACSDFHSPAVVRRGDLTVAISTGGKSPGLAAAIRRDLDARFGPEWAARLEQIARLRARWRDSGDDAAAIAQQTAIWLDGQLRLPRHTSFPRERRLSAEAPRSRPRPMPRHPGGRRGRAPISRPSPDTSGR